VSYRGLNHGLEKIGEIVQVLWNDGGQERNRTADASLFRAALYRTCTAAYLNNACRVTSLSGRHQDPASRDLLFHGVFN
jgi:hypothetical protein